MASTKMTVEEREAFLADLHVGVLSINNPGKAPLSAPVWYDYEPGGDVWLLTGPDSLKGRLLTVGGTASLVAQQEAMPYKYVTVECEVAAIEPPEDGELVAMAQRYLGEEQGQAYAAAGAAGSVRVSLRPTRWLTVDYSKSELLG